MPVELFKPGSPSLKLMELSYFIAPFPMRYVEYLSGKHEKNRSVCWRLRKKGYLKKEKLNTKPYVCMGKGLKNEPFDNANQWYETTRKYYYHVSTKRIKNQYSRRTDSISLAAITMMGADARVLPSEKPPLGKVSAPGEYYYIQRELMIGDEDTCGRLCRTTGALFTKNDAYSVYVQRKKAIKLRRASEIKMWLSIMRVATDMFGITGKKRKAIVLSEYDTFPSNLMENDGQAGTFRMFDELYFFDIRESKEHLRLFIENKLDNYIHPVSEKDTNTGNIDCDYHIEKTYVLEHFKPDVLRLERFINAARIRSGSANEQEFVIYCFDHQLPQLEQMTQGLVKIKTFSISEYTERMDDAGSH